MADKHERATRGEYRSIYVSLIDDPDFQDLSADARGIFYVLKLKLGLSGIGIFMEETLPRYTGIPFERVPEGLSELISKGWLKVERNVFWLRNGLRHDPSNPLGSKNHRTHIVNHIASLPKLAIVNEFARYYGLPEPFEIEPKNDGGGKGSERVSEGFGIPDTGYRIPEVTTTGDKSPEAPPRSEITPRPAEPLPPVEPGEPDDPDPDHREFNARIAPLIREHLWLGKYPPRLITRQDPGWNMGRELNVARRLVKRSGVTVEALEGAIRHARAALGFDDTVPLTTKIFHARGRHDRFELAVAAWRRSQIRTASGPEKAGDILAPLVAAAGGARG